MSLKLVPGRHGSPNYYIRGTFRGVRIDKSTGVGKKAEAAEVLAAFNRDLLNESLHGPAANRTFGDAALSYLEHGGERTHLVPLIEHFGERPLSRIGPNEVQAAAKKLSKRPGGMTLKPSTINRQIHTPLAAVLHHAAGLGWCPKPVISRPKQPKGRTRFITRGEAERLISVASPHLKPIIIFMLSTGARVSETLYLDWADVDLDAKRAVFWLTKNGENRGVRLHDRVVEQLRLMPHREGMVFRRHDGRPYAHRNGEGGGQLKTSWATMCKRAEIKDFTPHTCRHSWASWVYAETGRMNDLMELGGWKSEKMVMRYAHSNPDHLASTAGAVWGDSWGQQKTVAAKPLLRLA